LFFPCNKIKYSIHYGPQETEKAKEPGFSEWLDEQKKKEKLKEKPHYTLEELLKGGKQIYTYEELFGDAEPGKTRRVSSEYVKVFFPFVISRASKYKEYTKWEDSVLLMLEKKIKVRTELEREYEGLKKGRSILSTEELFRDDKTINAAKKKKGLSQLAKVNIKIYEIDEEIKAIYKEKNKEFHEKFGYDPYYHQVRAEGFFKELALLILMGGLAYTTLVGLRAIRVVLRKALVDRIKRRKTGIVLSLIGVGVLAAFLPLSISAGDETGITLLSITGITLFLVGIGMVIFSFFAEDANPKK
jgi:hypothetical protein